MSKKQQTRLRTNRKQEHQSRNVWLYVNIALAVVLILAGIGTLFWMGQQSSQSKASGNTTSQTVSQQGQPAPNFTLTSLKGESVQLTDYAGQVVLVNLWATWCPPCKAEMPTIHDYYQAHKDEGFVVLAVNSQEEAENVNTFIQANKFTFPVLLDSRGQVMNKYKVRGLPTSFIIDRDGVVQYTHTGQITKEQLEQAINPLL